MSDAQNNGNEVTRCEECGAYGAQDFGERKLCGECLQVIGSSCAGGCDEDEGGRDSGAAKGE